MCASERHGPGIIVRVVEEIRALLPLVIGDVEGDQDGIALVGNNWRLRVNTNWRVLRSGAIVLSSANPQVASPLTYGLEELVGRNVVDVGVQSRSVGSDLTLVTDWEDEFEILSDFPYGEWILSIWRSEDEARTPIFDWSGPVVS
jgi:hypothetical protein